MKSVLYYVASGPVRGVCGHHHRTEAAAQVCCDRDHSRVRAIYPSTFPTCAYSDRIVVAVHADGSETCPSSDREDDDMEAEYLRHAERVRQERD